MDLPSTFAWIPICLGYPLNMTYAKFKLFENSITARVRLIRMRITSLKKVKSRKFIRSLTLWLILTFRTKLSVESLSEMFPHQQFFNSLMADMACRFRREILDLN